MHQDGEDFCITVILLSSCRYRLCLEAFVKLNPRNLPSVIKAHLVCVRQLR